MQFSILRSLATKEYKIGISRTPFIYYFFCSSSRVTYSFVIEKKKSGIPRKYKFVPFNASKAPASTLIAIAWWWPNYSINLLTKSTLKGKERKSRLSGLQFYVFLLFVHMKHSICPNHPVDLF